MNKVLKIISVVGARPNFMKVAPLHREFIKSKQINHLICHTGQHYDDKMSKVFFKELDLPRPDYYLGIGSGSHSEQTGKVMIEFEKVLLKEKPDLVIVVGDVNSTIACSLASSKLGIKVAHIESGLRSNDRTMPEEINRLLTDAISDFLFVTEQSGIDNLKNEGVAENKIFFVGNVMIDSLVHYLDFSSDKILIDLCIRKGNYILVTMHRPFLVDNVERLKDLINMLLKLSEKRKIVFPVHPRTRKNIEQFIEIGISDDIILTEPVGYLDFISLMKNAEVVVTDSGGIQEETTFLGVQCVTVRDNTERPVTVEVGTNHLAGTDVENVYNTVSNVLEGYFKKGSFPELWDGNAAVRIVGVLKNLLN